MVTLTFTPLCDDHFSEGFTVTGQNFPLACARLLDSLADLFFTHDDEAHDSDEMFAEVFPVLEELAKQYDCSAERIDFSTPESNYRITRTTTTEAR